MKFQLKEKAIKLRKEGFSYTEILREVPVAKSTLSLWLRSVGLSRRQKQRLTEKKLLSAWKGGKARRLQRIESTKKIKSQAISEVGLLAARDLWLAGTMLYWAEGSKEKEYLSGVGIKFSNSDPFMIQVFVKWLKRCLLIKDKDIVFEIYVHENYKDRLGEILNFWAETTKYPLKKFDKVYYKRHNISSKRKRTGIRYKGQLIVKVRRSTNLNRKISGWIEGFYLQCGVV